MGSVLSMLLVNFLVLALGIRTGMNIKNNPYVLFYQIF